jgi:hypothetical protein
MRIKVYINDLPEVTSSSAMTFARNSDYNAFFRMETHLPFSLPFF